MKNAKELFNIFQCRNLMDNAVLYNIMDVIILAVIVDSRVKLLQDYLVLNVKNYSSMSTYRAACATLKCRSKIQRMPSEEIMESIDSSTHGGLCITKWTVRKLEWCPLSKDWMKITNMDIRSPWNCAGEPFVWEFRPSHPSIPSHPIHHVGGRRYFEKGINLLIMLDTGLKLMCISLETSTLALLKKLTLVSLQWSRPLYRS